MDYNSLFPLASAMWTSVALLAGGYARTATARRGPGSC